MMFELRKFETKRTEMTKFKLKGLKMKNGETQNMGFVFWPKKNVILCKMIKFN